MYSWLINACSPVTSSIADKCKAGFDYNSTILPAALNNLYSIYEETICCNTNNCNNQAGVCLTSEIASLYNLYNNNNNITNTMNYMNLISTSCSSIGGNTPLITITPLIKSTVTITVVVTLRVNLVYISDYGNLSSPASLDFIQLYKNFVNSFDQSILLK